MGSSVTRRLMIIPALLLCLILGHGFARPCAALEIRVKDQGVVQGDVIQLMDIASFHPADDPRVGKLGRFSVASAPAPGRDASLSRQFLNYKLASLVSDVGDVIIHMPETVSVKRAARVVSGKELEDIFKEEVRIRSGWDPEKIVFEKIQVPESVALPAGKVRWEILERGPDRYLGNVLMTLSYYVDGKQVRNVPVSGRVSVKREIIRAEKRISPGQVITKGDITYADDENGRPNRDALSYQAEVVGKKALRTIHPGQLITAQMIEDPPVVKKGSRVLIQARNEIILVSAAGKVLEDGRAGDQVRVVNVSSGKEVFGTVKGPGVVEVAF